jgi:hypothetical protein
MLLVKRGDIRHVLENGWLADELPFPCGNILLFFAAPPFLYNHEMLTPVCHPVHARTHGGVGEGGGRDRQTDSERDVLQKLII